MRWMFIAGGLMAAGMAVTLIRLWGLRLQVGHKGEISLAAMVREVVLTGSDGAIVQFVSHGQTMEFPVSCDIARQLQPGDRGILTYCEGNFVYFVPKAGLMDADLPGMQRVS